MGSIFFVQQLLLLNADTFMSVINKTSLNAHSNRVVLFHPLNLCMTGESRVSDVSLHLLKVFLFSGSSSRHHAVFY